VPLRADPGFLFSPVALHDRSVVQFDRYIPSKMAITGSRVPHGPGSSWVWNRDFRQLYKCSERRCHFRPGKTEVAVFSLGFHLQEFTLDSVTGRAKRAAG